MSERRRGSGALLAFCVIGILVMSIMVFTQGYLTGALSQTDAVLAGRQAEYLADGAMAEALLQVQEARNTTYVGLFQGGSSVAVAPALTTEIAEDGMSVETVVFSLNDSQDFHGDGRGFYGTISIEATVGVPRRVARAAGISTYRTVRHDFEYKGVLQGPPAEYGDKMLFAREMRNLPEVENWYEDELQPAWEIAQANVQTMLEEDAQEVVDEFGDFVEFAGRAADLLGRMLDWPASITGIGGPGVTSLPYDVDIDVRPEDISPLPGFLMGGITSLFDPNVEDIVIHLDANGDYLFDARRCLVACVGPREWVYDAPFIPSVKDVVIEVLDEAIEEAIEEVLPGLTAQEARDQLEQIADVNVDEFLDVVNSGDYPIPDLEWPPFREDGATLSDPAYVMPDHSPLTQVPLLLDPPDVPQPMPRSPLNEPEFNDYRNFDPFVWRDLLLAGGPVLGDLRVPFAAYPGEWASYIDPYIAAWETELRRLEGVISIGEVPEHALITPAYWAAMAAYEFPDTATGLAYIQARWGRAGAVYRFAADGEVQLGGMTGHGTFTTIDGGTMDVSGAGDGSHTVVAGRVTVNGSARAAIYSADEPVTFDGASVTGLVAAAGIKNAGRDDLDPFTITYDPMEGDLTFSVCEYPISVVLER